MNVSRSVSFVSGLGLGAGFIYFTNVDGRRHRAMVRDKLFHWGRVGSRYVDVGLRDLLNRSQGLFSKGVSYILPDFGLTDEVLAARVKSETGRCLSHPRAITVISNKRRITLLGPIPLEEAENFVSAVRGVKGVKSVDSQLELVMDPAVHPALQGGIPRSATRPSAWQRSLESPGIRLLASGAGIGLLSAGAKYLSDRIAHSKTHHPTEVYPDESVARSRLELDAGSPEYSGKPNIRVDHDHSPVPQDQGARSTTQTPRGLTASRNTGAGVAEERRSPRGY